MIPCIHGNTSVRNSENAAGQWSTLPVRQTGGIEEPRRGVSSDGTGVWKNETTSSSTGRVSSPLDGARSRPGISGPYGDMPENSWNSPGGQRLHIASPTSFIRPSGPILNTWAIVLWFITRTMHSLSCQDGTGSLRQWRTSSSHEPISYSLHHWA